MTLMTTITTPELGTVTVPIDAMFSLLGKKPMSGIALNVLPCVKWDYRAKNVSGGRRCIFSQSTAYKSRDRQLKRDKKYRRFLNA